MYTLIHSLINHTFSFDNLSSQTFLIFLILLSVFETNPAQFFLDFGGFISSHLSALENISSSITWCPLQEAMLSSTTILTVWYLFAIVLFPNLSVPASSIQYNIWVCYTSTLRSTEWSKQSFEKAARSFI